MEYRKTLIVSIAVLAGAFVLGFGIRQIRMSRAVVEIEPASPGRAVVKDRKAALDSDIDPGPGFEDGTELESDLEEAETIADEEQMMEEPVGETEDVEAIVEAEEEYDEPEPEFQCRQFGSGAGAIQQFFAELNLNEEETGRLQEGMMLRRQQFERMSERERQAEFERMREMGERWQNMNEREQDDVKRRMLDRYEDWRRSDSIDLPELRLD